MKPRSEKHVPSVVKSSTKGSLPWLCTLLIFMVACQSASREDRERLSSLQSTYGNRYVLSLKGEFHLLVRQRATEPVPETEIENIYKAFFFKYPTEMVRRETSFVYLNVYDKDGRFLYQLAYSPSRHGLIRSDREAD